MQMVTTIRLDIAKSVFQVHRVDAAGWGAILAKTGMTDALRLKRSAFPGSSERPSAFSPGSDNLDS
jgi:hypothetical protein